MRELSSRKCLSSSPPRGITTSAAAGLEMNSRRRSRSASISCTASTGRPLLSIGRAHQVDQHPVGVCRHPRTPQYAGISGLERERGGIGGDVGPGLVDDRDHTQRHPHLLDHQAVVALEPAEHGADRVGQRRTTARTPSARPAMRSGVSVSRSTMAGGWSGARRQRRAGWRPRSRRRRCSIAAAIASSAASRCGAVDATPSGGRRRERRR